MSVTLLGYKDIMKEGAAFQSWQAGYAQQVGAVKIKKKRGPGGAQPGAGRHREGLRLSIRLRGDQIEALDALAEERGVSRAEALRLFLDENGLSRPSANF